MSCPDRESLSAFADGAVEAASRAELERHLVGCTHAANFGAGMCRLNERGRDSLQAIPVSARVKPIVVVRKASRPRLIRALALAAAAVLLMSVAALLIAHRIKASRPMPVMVSKQPPSEEKFVPPSDSDFEAWAAPFRRVHVPLVPMEDVPTTGRRKFTRCFPKTAAPRNQS